MRITIDVAGNLAHQLKEAGDNLAAVMTNAIADAGEWLQQELRGQVRAAGLGAGLEKAWRFEAYPPGKRASTRAAVLVFSKAQRLHAAFETGATIRAMNAKWLVLPLPAAEALGFWERPKGRRGKFEMYNNRVGTNVRWSNVEAAIGRYGRLRFVPLDGGRKALLVADGLSRGRQRTIRKRLVGAGSLAAANQVRDSVPLFLLLKQTRIAKRLDIAGAAERARDRVPAEVERELRSVRA